MRSQIRSSIPPLAIAVGIKPGPAANLREESMKKVQYAIWNDEEDGQFWELFDSIEDAVDGRSGGPVEVYRMEARHLGRFKRAVKTVRVKRRKRSRK